MRQIATFDDERTAKRFADVLCARQIDTEISRAREGAYGVWVLEEADVEPSRAAYAAFDANPDGPEHLAAEGCVEKKQKAAATVGRKSRHEVIEVRKRFGGATGAPPLVTLVLIGISVVVTLLTGLAHRVDLLARLSIGTADEVFAGREFFHALHGEPWRLVTPIFLHYGLLHILFNMLMLFDLGSAIESRIGAPRFTALVLFSAILPNAAQYAWTGSPLFGGMSGVVCALFTYAWVRGRLDRPFGLVIATDRAVLMLIWVGLGFVNVIEGLANVVHLGGLLTGAALGAWAAFRARP